AARRGRGWNRRRTSGQGILHSLFFILYSVPSVIGLHDVRLWPDSPPIASRGEVPSVHRGGERRHVREVAALLRRGRAQGALPVEGGRGAVRRDEGEVPAARAEVVHARGEVGAVRLRQRGGRAGAAGGVRGGPGEAQADRGVGVQARERAERVRPVPDGDRREY